MAWKDWHCNGCEKAQDGAIEERYSFGLYAGRYHEACWKRSGYRDEPASAFDPTYAGEAYEDDY